MFKLTHSFLNNFKNNNKNLAILRYDKYMKSTVAEAKSTHPNLENEISTEETLKPNNYIKPRNSMVAAAFASLKPYSRFDTEIVTPITDDKIKRAATVDDLLSISEGSGISRRHALKVVSTLAEWSSSGKTKLSDFENDTRFIKLCRILSRGAKINRNVASRSEDLSTILSVTADDEAARLISGLNLTQMVKVMSTLSMRKRRSVVLLRTLAYNLTASSEVLNLKQSADLLYSMCLLNFVDINLLVKICGDVSNMLRQDLKKSAAVGSVITSLGLLKYKNCEILDELSDWILKNHTICRPQDLFSLFTTLATVNYLPSNFEELFKVLLPQLSLSEARKNTVWLNFIWSLVVLNQASSDHVSSVLNEDFIKNVEENSSSNIASKLKLLNINGAANYLLKDYKGDFLSSSSSVYDVNIVKTKEKNELKKLVVDTLKNLIHTEDHFKIDKDTGLGCSIDVEVVLDKKCNPLPLSHPVTDSSNTRVAIVVYDYHDMCLGKNEPTGVNSLTSRLLEAQNYKVLAIPYTEFKITDKLIHRVQYIENRLKNIVK